MNCSFRKDIHCEQGTLKRGDACHNTAEYISAWPVGPLENAIDIMCSCQECLAKHNLGRAWTWIEHDCAKPMIEAYKRQKAKEVMEALNP